MSIAENENSQNGTSYMSPTACRLAITKLIKTLFFSSLKESLAFHFKCSTTMHNGVIKFQFKYQLMKTVRNQYIKLTNADVTY